MNTFKMIVRWYFLLKKRLLKKPAFLLILLSIPLLTFAFSHFATTEDTGFLHIALASKENSEYAEEVMERISDSSSVIRFFVDKDPETARKRVERGECDGAWILEEGLRERIETIAKGETAVLATAIERDESTLNDIAKESIFIAFFDEIAYCMFEDRANETAPDFDKERLKELFEENYIDGELILFEYAKSGKVDLEGVNYLTSPLRGLLCVVMLMCALAASVYFLADERDGTFTRLSRDRRFFVLFGTNLAALTVSAVFVSAALYFTGNYTDFLTETVLMLLYIIALCGFSSALGSIVSNVGTFCVMLPVLTVVSLVLSPVFFDLMQLKAIQVLLPMYHYLYAASGVGSIGYFALYAVAASAISYALFVLTVRIRYQSSAKSAKLR